jgi:hypothetical protein
MRQRTHRGIAAHDEWRSNTEHTSEKTIMNKSILFSSLPEFLTGLLSGTENSKMTAEKVAEMVANHK